MDTLPRFWHEDGVLVFGGTDVTSATADVLSVAAVRGGKIFRALDYPFDETPELVVWGPRSGQG